MTKLILSSSALSLEEAHGQFRFLAPGGWTMAQFPIERIPEMIALLQLLQQEWARDTAEHERAATEEDQDMEEADADALSARWVLTCVTRRSSSSTGGRA